MKATDGRFAAAQNQAHDVLTELKAGQQAMLVEASFRPRVRVPFTDDHRELQEALAALQPSDAPGDLEAAITLASDLASYITGQVLVVDGGMVM